MAQSISKPTNEEARELYELAAMGKRHGLSEAVRWLMAAMKKSGSSPSGPRKRTVSLVDGAGRPWHIDHVVPVALGGTDDEDNLTLACASCNLKKSDRLVSELGWCNNAQQL